MSSKTDVHLENHDKSGKVCLKRLKTPVITSNYQKVTCPKCRHSASWQRAYLEHHKKDRGR